MYVGADIWKCYGIDQNGKDGVDIGGTWQPLLHLAWDQMS